MLKLAAYSTLFARPQSPRRHFADYMGEGKDQLLWGGVNVTFSF